MFHVQKVHPECTYCTQNMKKSAPIINPCDKCPLNSPDRPKISPALVQDPILGVVGLAPGDTENQQKIVFVGPAGQLLRSEGQRAGLPIGTTQYPLALDIKISIANLTRCQPDNDNFEDPKWKKAMGYCWKFLEHDIAGDYPLLALGSQPLQKILGDKSARVSKMRGLWHTLPSGRQIFSTWHPSYVLREVRRVGEESTALRQFRRDLQRVVDRISGQEKLPDIKYDIFKDPGEAKPFLTELAKYNKPWVFDIESFDAQECPSRRSVGTDPFHPDFRVRGIGFAWKPDRGAYVELTSWDQWRRQAAEIFGPAFASPALKWAFNGTFDEEGLVYNGWVPEINNRRGDGLMGVLSINAGGLPNFTLERCVVDILGEAQYWGVDKSLIRELPLEKVAESAVRDCASTYKLVKIVHQRLINGQYITTDVVDEIDTDEEAEW